LPAYHYGHDTPRFRDKAIAFAEPETTANWYAPHVVHQEYVCCCGQRKVCPVHQPLIPGGSKEALIRTVRRKPFHFPAASLTANHVTLQQVGLSIYDTGIIAASGRVSHDGGPVGALAGARITIILRAYAAPITSRELPLDSPMVWEARRQLWVSRNQPNVVSLAAADQGYFPQLRERFDEITHLEVELESRQGR
jgi:hypothetical protein